MRAGKIVAVMLLAAAVLTAAGWLRGAEYDEQYTLFLTGGTVRPVWPTGAISAADVLALQDGRTSLAAIAQGLRASDVHPPLYFWLIALWRGLVGDGLFAARMFSVMCGVVALGSVGAIARQAAVPTTAAMLLTLGCYGFAFSDAVARGFALAQMLNLAGIALLLFAQRRRRCAALCGGLLLGAASFTNYLAAFVGCAGLLWTVLALRRSWIWTALGFAIWLPADLWFFLAQRNSRIGQFEPFSLASGLVRLIRYGTAAVFGGLPLYVSGLACQAVAMLLAALMLALLAVAIIRWRRVHSLFAMAAVAPPLGLLLLGLAFDTTPIELRYLAFATPFIGLVLASVLPRGAVCVVLAIQVISLAGLMTRAETMQPARMAAHDATRLAGNGVVLVPHGNDGVGIVGAFAREAPATLRLLVVRRDDSPAQILTRTGNASHAVLALLGQDADSRAALPHMREAFATPCWRPAGQGFNVLAFERICGGE
jgi:uncharacterized membrane protein